jgi:hypothetical protein
MVKKQFLDKILVGVSSKGSGSGLVAGFLILKSHGPILVMKVQTIDTAVVMITVKAAAEAVRPETINQGRPQGGRNGRSTSKSNQRLAVTWSGQKTALLLVFFTPMLHKKDGKNLTKRYVR